MSDVAVPVDIDVDVIVLDVDGGLMLRDCLASIAAQTRPPRSHRSRETTRRDPARRGVSDWRAPFGAGAFTGLVTTPPPGPPAYAPPPPPPGAY